MFTYVGAFENYRLTDTKELHQAASRVIKNNSKQLQFRYWVESLTVPCWGRCSFLLFEILNNLTLTDSIKNRPSMRMFAESRRRCINLECHQIRHEQQEYLNSLIRWSSSGFYSSSQVA